MQLAFSGISVLKLPFFLIRRAGLTAWLAVRTLCKELRVFLAGQGGARRKNTDSDDRVAATANKPPTVRDSRFPYISRLT
jgi:hypothetical protein